MPEIIETTVYRLDELSDTAKDKARAWYREGGFDYEWYDAVYEDFQRIAEILGIDFRIRAVRLMGGGTRRDPCIWFRGFWSQGDGACWEGRIPTPEMPRPKSGPMRRRIRSFIGSLTPCRRSSAETSTSFAPRPAIAGIIITSIAWRSRSSATVRHIRT